MLAISDLHVAYGQSEVLHGLNVSVAPNEIVAIMGRNGMGKTTLMKSLMGIVPTKSGSVTMEGAELSTLKSYERVAKGLAYVPQGRMIFSSMTVKENIETGLVASGETEVPGVVRGVYGLLQRTQQHGLQQREIGPRADPREQLRVVLRLRRVAAAQLQSELAEEFAQRGNLLRRRLVVHAEQHRVAARDSLRPTLPGLWPDGLEHPVIAGR